MKNMYVCECCGFQSTDYDEVARCERTHSRSVDMLETYHLTEEMAQKFSTNTYLEGQTIPDVVTLRIGLPDPDGWDLKQDENGNRLYAVVQYKRIEKRAPLLNEVEQDIIKRQEIDRVEHEEYMKRRAAEEEATKKETTDEQ